jgi:hypothetical protein
MLATIRASWFILCNHFSVAATVGSVAGADGGGSERSGSALLAAIHRGDAHVRQEGDLRADC